jgi:hypothetical protein
MGSIIRRHICGFTVSRKWAWEHFEGDEANFYRAISSSFSDDSSRETLSDWERLDYSDDGDMDETFYR